MTKLFRLEKNPMKQNIQIEVRQSTDKWCSRRGKQRISRASCVTAGKALEAAERSANTP